MKSKILIFSKKTSSLFVLSDAGNFKQMFFFRFFEKKIENFRSPENFHISKSQNFSSFSKTSLLSVLNNTDHFKPMLFFSIFGQLAN